MKGKIFQNVSGKRIQVPNRLSEEFCWVPCERIQIIEEKGCLTNSGEIPGYIVHNMDYKGAIRAHETSWISEQILKESFREINNVKFIIKEDMERQISEMWDAINDIPTNDPDRDYACNQAQETENKLRESYRKQEQLRDSAPELLQSLEAAIYFIQNCPLLSEDDKPRGLEKWIERINNATK